MADTIVVEVPETTASAPRETSSTSWGAIFAGAFVIAAFGLLLLALGAGFGLSAVSPWPGAGISATTFGVVTVIWLVVVQWISSALGGYVAGRLRTRWNALHTDESYFRDTAHGVLAWAVAVVFSAAVLAGASSLFAGAATVGAEPSRGASEISPVAAPSPYIVDTLFRTDRGEAGTAGPDPRPEATRILATGLRPRGKLSEADRAYLARLVAARTGVSQDEAQKRVDDAMNSARQAADTARRAARDLALVAAFSMLIGAFIAAVAAKIGGHHRDDLAVR